MYRYDRRAKKAAAGGPDPLSLKAFLSEYEIGVKRGTTEGERPTNYHGLVTVTQEEVKEAATEVKQLMDRILTTAQRGDVKVNPQRFCSSLSTHLSTLLYQLGVYEGLSSSGRYASANSLKLYEVRGNVKSLRLGKVFPTGWTPLTPPGQMPVLVAADGEPNDVQGTDVTPKGSISRADVIKRQQSDAWD